MLSLLWACRADELTQLVVVVDADFEGLSRLEIDLEGLGDVPQVEADLEDDGGLPRRLALLHEGGPLGPFGLEIHAYVKDREEPLLSARRSELHFVRGKAMMLKVDLLAECVGKCAGRACAAEGRCVDTDDERLISLRPWNGEIDGLTVIGRVVDGGFVDVLLDGSMRVPDGGTDASEADAEGGLEPPDGAPPDSGPPVVHPAVFAYKPSNFDTRAESIPRERAEVLLDCGTSSFDSGSLAFSEWCGQEPDVQVLTQSDGSELVLLVMDTFRLLTGSGLRLTGSRPIAFAIFGDAIVSGRIDASASGSTPGPGGGGADCAGAGADGGDGSGETVGSAGGGGGGGFGSSGAAGGASSEVPGGTAGGEAGEPILSPLRGGCPGGAGGLGDGEQRAAGGGGGGGLQLSAAGQLEVNGTILASGGGGEAGGGSRHGGGGGGSGGAILLEGGDLDIDSAAVISVNGGGGGAGQPTARVSADGTAGADGVASIAAAPAGTGTNSGGDGGNGAALTAPAGAGQEGQLSVLDNGYGGGGGGGGGVGRIRVTQSAECALRGVFSPLPVVECTDCGECPRAPALQCAFGTLASNNYVLCEEVLNWETAAARCDSVGLRLVRIDDEEENDFIASAIAVDTWLGGSDAEVEGEWRWQDDGAQFWMGDATGSVVGERFTAWGSREPAGVLSTADCLGMTANGRWEDVACGLLQGYACE